MYSMEVRVRFSIVGFHKWEAAPPTYSYLANRHRHMFAVGAYRPVGHADREIEINRLQADMESFLHERFGAPCEFGGMSCESIARMLADQFDLSECVVLEDGMNGARVRRMNG